MLELTWGLDMRVKPGDIHMKTSILLLAAVLPAAGASIQPGQDITVRTGATIHAREADESHIFPAVIQHDVMDRDGHVAIPRGSSAELVVRRTAENELVLDLRAVNIDGRRYILDTEDVVESGSAKDGVGANRRTGKFLGGGALIGGIIGAIAGGGKGAAIGAASGAAVGAGTEMATRGHMVRVPAESILTFRLERGVRITEYSQYR